jgi:hypothetical protein
MTKNLVYSIINEETGVEVVNVGFTAERTLEIDETRHEDDPQANLRDKPSYSTLINYVELVIAGVGLLQPESYWKDDKVVNRSLYAMIDENVAELFEQN